MLRGLRKVGTSDDNLTPRGIAMFPKVRLDALHDGIFSVAMTLLVLDVRLPEEFHPRDSAELVTAIANLWPKFLPYLLSFMKARRFGADRDRLLPSIPNGGVD